MTKSTAVMIPARIATGVQRLDARFPKWRQLIDLDRLDLRSTKTCVLGQLYGDFDEGLNDLGINGVYIEAYDDTIAALEGFDIGQLDVEPADGSVDADDAYYTLTETWREYIRASL